MRYLSHTSSASCIFAMEGTCSFPGEISSRLIQLLEIEESLFALNKFEDVYHYVFDMVFSNKRSARETLKANLAPSDYRVLNSFRLWLARLDRDDRSVIGSIHTICNLNKGTSLVFVHYMQSGVTGTFESLDSPFLAPPAADDFLGLNLD